MVKRVGNFDLHLVSNMWSCRAIGLEEISTDICKYELPAVVDGMKVSMFGSSFSRYNKCDNLHLDLSRVDMSNAIEFINMFYKSKGIKSVKFPNVEVLESVDLTEMVAHSQIEEIDFNNMKANVKCLHRLFYESKRIREVNWGNLRADNCSDLYGMFECCGMIEKIDLTSLNLIKASTMDGICKWCNSLKSFKFGEFRDSLCSDVVSLNEMFSGCYELESVELPRFSSCYGVTCDEMFCNCHKLREVKISGSNSVRGAIDLRILGHSCKERMSNIFNWVNLGGKVIIAYHGIENNLKIPEIEVSENEVEYMVKRIKVIGVVDEDGLIMYIR